MAPLILILFIFLTIIIALAWFGFYRLSVGLFVVFLLAGVGVFWHHMTDVIPLNL